LSSSPEDGLDLRFVFQKMSFCCGSWPFDGSQPGHLGVWKVLPSVLYSPPWILFARSFATYRGTRFTALAP
jgi:hypothetical protein